MSLDAVQRATLLDGLTNRVNKLEERLLTIEAHLDGIGISDLESSLHNLVEAIELRVRQELADYDDEYYDD